MTEHPLTSVFRRYAEQSGPWTGGDSTASVPLSGGRTLWLFSDVMCGPPTHGEPRPRTTTVLRNAAVLQSGDTLITIADGHPATPRALIDAAEPGQHAWIASAADTPTGVQVLTNTYRTTGTGQFDFALTGTQISTLDPRTFTAHRTYSLHLGSRIAWGSALLDAGLFTYVYGTEYVRRTGERFVHLARTDRGRLDLPWEFFGSELWGSNGGNTVRLASGVGTAFAVERRERGRLVLVTADCRDGFSADIVAYIATHPTGPFVGPVPLFTAPEPAERSGVFVYDVRTHPHLASPGTLLVSYNVHSLNPDDLYDRPDIYRPRFVELPYPH